MLEKQLSENTDALRENTEMVKQHTELLIKLTSQGKEVQKGEASTKADSDAEKPAKRGRPKKEKAPTIAEMKKIGTEYVDVEDEDEYNERRTLVRAIAEYFEVEKFSEIASKDRLTAKKIIEAAASGENVDPDDLEGFIEELGGSGDDEAPPPRSRRSADGDI